MFHVGTTFERSVGEKSLPEAPLALRKYKGNLKEPRETMDFESSIRCRKVLQM